MGRNINKQSQIFCNILTRMDNFIWRFLIFTGVGTTAKYG